MLFNIKVSKLSVFHIILLLLSLLAAVCFSDSDNPVRVKLQHSVFDDFNRRHPRQKIDQVVIVDIDEKSLEIVGQWGWPRNVLAELVNNLKEDGASVIAFDGVFAEEDRSSPHLVYSDLAEDYIKALSSSVQKDGVLLNYDEIFARAIKDSEIFVTAFTYGRLDRNISGSVNKNRILARSDVKSIFVADAVQFAAAAVNLPILSKAAAGSGSFMADPDNDGILRRASMIFSDGKEIYPSLSLEALRVSLSGRKGAIRLADVPEEDKALIDTNYRIIVGDKEIPVESDGVLYVYYRHYCTSDDVASGRRNCTKPDYISAYKFLNEEFRDEVRDFVKGKVVLIGASAEGLKDLRSTALEPFIPGVEVHANVIEQVLGDSYLKRPSITKGVEASYIMVVGLLFIIISPFVGVIVSMALCFVIISIASFGAYYVYVKYGLLVDPVYSSLSVLSIFVISTILSYIRVDSRRKQIRNAFGMYVSSEVMQDLEKHPEKLKLGGESRELTVMFTDVRKFTSISEKMSPQELIQLMNEFLTYMSDIVMEHQGTVDKYIGDAMMSFWNAPRDVEDHEVKACIAALNMQDAFKPINDRLKKQAEEQGISEPLLLRAGIGINSGLCAVGNMGSRQRFAYSALGDTVNIASRLEGQTRPYGVDIIISKSVYDKILDFATLELDEIRVIGKQDSVRIYVLIGDEKYAGKLMFKKWKSLHNEMLEAYRDGRFIKAKFLAQECANVADDGYENLYDMYESRMEELSKTGIPKNWDGIIDALTK